MLVLFGPIQVFAQGAPEGGESTFETRELREVTVNARRSIEDRFMAPGSLVVIDRRDIEALGAFSVADVLRQLPGLQVTPTAEGGVVIRMRGMDANATQLLIDGQRVSSGRSQLPLDQLPAELIERVEVVRSPSAEFSGATGGTLNIVLRQATVKRETNIRLTDNHVWGGDAGQVFVSNSGPIGGGAGRGAAQKPADGTVDAAASAIAAQPWAYFVAVSSIGTLLGADTARQTIEGGQLTANTTATSRFRRGEQTILPRMSGRLGANDQLALRATLSRTDFGGGTVTQGSGTLGNQPVNINAQENNNYQRQYLQAAGDWTHRFAGSKLETTLSGSQGRDSVNREGAVVGNLAAGGQISDLYGLIENRQEDLWSIKTKLTGTTSQLLWSLGAELETRSLDVASQSTSSLSAIATSQNLGARLRRQIVWGQNEWALANTTLTAGLRAEALNIDSSDAATLASQQLTFLQPSLHARTPINDDLQLRANLARVTRNPSVWDLVNRTTPAAGSNTITNPDVSGNANLRPELALSLDVGFDRRLARQGQAGLNLFVRQVQDTLATLVTFTGGRWVQQRTNVGDALVWGLEADVKSGLTWAGLGPDWTMSANASLLQSRMTSGPNQGNRIPGQALYLANLNVAKPLRRAGGLFGGFTLSAVGRTELNTSPGIAGSDKPYATLDLYVGGVLPALGYWRVGAFNIGNAEYGRERNYANAAGNPAQDTSSTTYTPRLYFTIGTQFCDNFKPC